MLDHAVAWAHPTAVVTLEKVHRFTDPGYAALSLRMRTGDGPGGVFDALHRRGQVVIHASEVERSAVLADAGAGGELVIADTREQVADLNAAIRDHRQRDRLAERSSPVQGIGSGSVTGSRPDATTPTSGREPPDLDRHRDRRRRQPPPARPRPGPRDPGRLRKPVRRARLRNHRPRLPGQTVGSAHVAIGDTTGAAAAYVAMTRGRESNVAHLVAENADDARKQWIEVFSRDRADLGPAHARRQAHRRDRPLRPPTPTPASAGAAHPHRPSTSLSL